MAIKLSTDFRLKLPGGCQFSSREAGFIVVESRDLPGKGEKAPPLLNHHHCEFMANIMRRERGKCLWVVDCPCDSASKLLKERFPKHQMIGISIAGYFECDAESVAAFWNIFAELWRNEPWNMEQPWTLAGVSNDLPVPTPSKSWFRSSGWSIDHVLRNHGNVDSFFVQMGWFAFFGLRESKYPIEMIFQEFPSLNK